MGMLIVQHRVKDYRKWRRAYDAQAPMRRKAGLGSGHVYRSADSPDQIAIVFKTKDSVPERPPEASADTWRRYQQAFDALQIGSPKSGRTKRR
jgi:hypothetical protein